MTSIHLRAMRELDLPTVHQLEKACQPFPWPLWCFRSVLRSGASCWLLAKDSEAIGFGILRIEKHQAHIMNMCVAPSHRRQGLGRRIMLHLLAVANKKHARKACLEVRSTNQAAILLYRKLGFRASEMRKGYYLTSHGRQNALIMVRKL